MLSALVGYLRLQKLRAGKTIVSIAGLTFLGVTCAFVFPNATQSVLDRFEMIVPTGQSTEGSAADRLTIVSNSPVFEMDSYWLFGHGHSSYRFIADQHLSTIMSRSSRSLYNFPMTVWYDSGLAGILLWVLLLFQFDRFLKRAIRDSRIEVSALAEGLRAALWGTVLASMFSEIPYNWRVMGFFYNALGICIAAAKAPIRVSWRQTRS
jgi:hypothetical protein